VFFHPDRQDTQAEGWRHLLALIDEATADGRAVFKPFMELSGPERRQIITLPPVIAKLTAVKHLVLYRTNLVRIPAEIGAMTSLEVFEPYTSHRLHWYPYELTRCMRLARSTVSTRVLCGNFKSGHRSPRCSRPLALGRRTSPRSTRPSGALMRYGLAASAMGRSPVTCARCGSPARSAPTCCRSWSTRARRRVWPRCRSHTPVTSRCRTPAARTSCSPPADTEATASGTSLSPSVPRPSGTRRTVARSAALWVAAGGWRWRCSSWSWMVTRQTHSPYRWSGLGPMRWAIPDRRASGRRMTSHP
jgi:hypothetical protein